jgi:hypothetical protein
MGFFKDLMNKVTGGAATVRVNLPSSVKRGQAAAVQVQATAKANGKVSAVYLLVRSTELAEFKAEGEKVRGEATGFETRIQIAGAQELKEGETYTWDGQLELPVTTYPTMRGQIVQHTWHVQAGLDMPGNDPDSGWQPVEVA